MFREQRHEFFPIPGATTVGLVFKNGVILASEKRVSYGYLVLSKSVKKIFKITERIGAACAGLVSDMQVLIREVQAWAKLYELDANRPMTVRASAKLISNLLFRNRLFPLLTQTIIGGVDNEGAIIYALDPLGSVIPDKYAVAGSGAEMAIGVLEAGYKDGLTADEAKELTIRSIKSAIMRDAASGDGIDLLVITENGSTEESLPL